MGAGRFICVGMPLLLTLAAIVSLLYATLSGVSHNRLTLFSLNTGDLSIDTVNLKNVGDKLFDVDIGKRADNVKSTNITAADLDLARLYYVSLWGYCYVEVGSDRRHCTDAKFNWAADKLNSSTIEDTRVGGKRLELPDEIEGAMKAFVHLSKWTQVTTIIALIALALELVLGVFSNFSRVVSCVTWLVASIATSLVCAAAALATTQAVVVIGAIEATAKWYGVRGSINGRYLATVWISFAFALAAGLFWIFTICCCKPEHRSKSKRNSSGGEKMFGAGGSGYAPLGDSHEMTPGNYHHQQPTTYGAPRYPDPSARTDMAYEPYSHRV